MPHKVIRANNKVDEEFLIQKKENFFICNNGQSKQE